MTHLTPPPAAPKHPDVFLEFVRQGREEVEAVERSMNYRIALARNEGIPWLDIANASGYSVPTLRRRVAGYVGEQDGAA